jgi:hypothetical protein
MMRYRFTSWWAAFMIVTGIAILAGALVAAGFAVAGDLPGLERLGGPGSAPRWTAAALVACAGLVFGGPLVMIGQTLQVFLDQRRLLGQIRGQLRSVQAAARAWEWERERREESGRSARRTASFR